MNLKETQVLLATNFKASSHVPLLWRQDGVQTRTMQDMQTPESAILACAGPASASLAEEIPARARLMGAGVSSAPYRGDKLGLQSHLLPYWQPGVDPTDAWHAYEKHVRVLYAKWAPHILLEAHTCKA